eukprot:5672970-Pyramimonas_sp.AAC.1
MGSRKHRAQHMLIVIPTTLTLMPLSHTYVNFDDHRTFCGLECLAPAVLPSLLWSVVVAAVITCNLFDQLSRQL